MQTLPETQILSLSGTAQERGKAHGESMRSQIHDLLERWKEFLSRYSTTSLDTYIHALVSETGFIQAVEHWTPGLLDEVKGIADGANASFEDIFGFQLQDEEWWFGQELSNNQRADALHCSSIGWTAHDGSSSLVAQNMDMPDYLDGYQVILKIADPENGLESLVFSTAGLIALNGINNHGIGIVCNNLGRLNHTREGLPVAFVHRGVLEKKTLGEAMSFLQSIRHASGQNYLLGCPEEIIDLECSANQTAPYRQPGRLYSVCHTNHPFTNDDFIEKTAPAEPSSNRISPTTSIYDVDSRMRMESISQNSEMVEQDAASTKTARIILSAHDSRTNPVCRHSSPDNPWMTIGTSILVLNEHPQLHFCPGPPCSSAFTIFKFSQD
jgi:isopenicillin-N N-acyltransferase like protein